MQNSMLALRKMIIACLFTAGVSFAIISQAEAANPSNFFSFNMPIGVVATEDALIFTGYYASWSGTQTIYAADSSGTVRSFAAGFPSAVGYNEKYADISPGKGGFPKDYVYVIQTSQIYEIAPDGSSTRLFATIPRYNWDHNGITFDRVGTFDYQLIVTLSSGYIYTIDASGNVKQLAYIGAGHENPEVVPEDFGPYGGYVWTASESTGRVYAISPSGAVHIALSGIRLVESLHMIPDEVCEFGTSGGAFFITNYPYGVVKFPSSDFAGLGGNLLATVEGGSIYMISKNAAGTGYSTSVFDSTYRHHEGGTFARCPLNRPPVADAGPDQTVECAGPDGNAVTLDGSGSSDPDGDALTYTWTWPGGTASGVSPSITLPLGTHTITLTVDDGKGGTATDEVMVTVRDTTPPVTAVRTIAGIAGDNGWYTSDVLITVDSADSCSGVREIGSTVDGRGTTTPGGTAAIAVNGDGTHTVTFGATDNAGNVEQPKSLTIKIDKTAPAAELSVTPGVLWPPNHKMADVLVNGGTADGTSGIASVVITVTDEYGTVQPVVSGFGTTIPLEAWREGTDRDGRHYAITAVVTDTAGNTTTVTTEAVCPHDMRDKR